MNDETKFTGTVEAQVINQFGEVTNRISFWADDTINETNSCSEFYTKQGFRVVFNRHYYPTGFKVLEIRSCE